MDGMDGALEGMAARAVMDDGKLSYAAVKDGWGSATNFMLSYGLKPWNEEDLAEAGAISAELEKQEQTRAAPAASRGGGGGGGFTRRRRQAKMSSVGCGFGHNRTQSTPKIVKVKLTSLAFRQSNFDTSVRHLGNVAETHYAPLCGSLRRL